MHALGQIANIKVDTEMDAHLLLKAINGNIKNNDIYILDCKKVDNEFHSRFSALRREYIYKISSKYNPINRKYYWSIFEELDVEKLNKCANLILGEHDFTLLSKKNEEIDNKICIIYNSDWEIIGEKMYYRIISNRFLHHMVRYLVGVMVEISKNVSVDISDFISMINAENRKTLYRAPAKGLYLQRVYYD